MLEPQSVSPPVHIRFANQVKGKALRIVSSSKKTSLKKGLLLGLSLFCFFSLFSPLDGISGSTLRRLAGGNGKKDVPEFMPSYNEFCPLSLPEYMGHKDSEAADLISQESGAFKAVQSAMEAGAFTDRKIVILGDSTYRQVVSSLACLLHTGGFWESNDSFVTGFVTGSSDRSRWYDARVRLKDGGEIFYAPLAGNVLTHWSGVVDGIQLLKSTEDWLQNCEGRTPFYLNHYTISATNGEYFEEYSEENTSLEKIKLGKKDFLIFQGGHHTTRAINIKKFGALIKCVEEAKASGEDPGWPTIKYARSTPRHFKSENGKEIRRGETCALSNDEDPQLVEELGVLGKDYKMVGSRLNVLSRWGNAHQYSGKDCVHFKMPGVPELYTREVANAIMALP